MEIVSLGQMFFRDDFMLFEQFFEPISSTYTYLLADEKIKKALIIDPVKSEVDNYLNFLKAMGYTLSIAMDTHIHADHITATGTLQDATHCRILMGHCPSTQGLCETLKDGEWVELGEIKLQALYTPGHTSDSYCFLMNDRIFTGDTLLIGGTGRTDFQNGDAVSAYKSLFERILTLDDSILVYPAHDYKGNKVSTVGDEKSKNPRLQVKSQEEYQEIMANLNLPRPKQMDIAVPANLKLGRVQ